MWLLADRRSRRTRRDATSDGAAVGSAVEDGVDGPCRGVVVVDGAAFTHTDITLHVPIAHDGLVAVARSCHGSGTDRPLAAATGARRCIGAGGFECVRVDRACCCVVAVSPMSGTRAHGTALMRCAVRVVEDRVEADDVVNASLKIRLVTSKTTRTLGHVPIHVPIHVPTPALVAKVSPARRRSSLSGPSRRSLGAPRCDAVESPDTCPLADTRRSVGRTTLLASSEMT